jgi:hypothetical protein
LWWRLLSVCYLLGEDGVLDFFDFYGMYWRGPGLWFFLFDLLLMRMSTILSKKKKIVTEPKLLEGLYNF